MQPLLLPLAALAAWAAPGPAGDYARDVKPLLKARCSGCHGALAQKAKLRLDTRDAILTGGRKGPAVVPGRPEKSLLIERVCASDEGERMPPDGPTLSAEQVAVLRAWIRNGAKGPAKERPEEDPREHWAFQPIRRPPIPSAQDGWAANPVDRFLAAEHARRGLRPTCDAPPEVLLRRLHVDLTGLPPTPKEVHSYLAGRAPGAYALRVEELLARPQHGERWARHWMDVWRYSDWFGRRAVPDVWNSAPQVWRWRDWITDSLNADRSYARMLQEMLAADEVAPGDEEAVVATGYLVRNWYALNPNQWLRDVVEHTGKAFLGLTLQCAHCHDHKYDPISQEEYFRFRAFFEPMGLRQDRVRGEPDPGPFQKYEYGVLRKVARLGSVSVFDEHPDAKTWMYNLGDERGLVKGRPPVPPGAPAFLGGDQLKIEPVRLPVEVYQPAARYSVKAEPLGAAERAVAVGRRARPTSPVYPSTSTGRRKALAEWMTSRDNPLVARVAVNHVWRWHFGRPLVETVADFGRNGKRPTHPELLDWLACELIDSGWSLKHLHRLIVTSRAYRMHSAADAEAQKADPDNRWLTRFPRRRLEAEALRDGMLFVAGELDLTMGGAPVENSAAETAFRRRSLYFSVYPEGGGQPRFLETFDAPDPCDCYVRTESVVPQQALALTNSKLVEHLSAALARELLAQERHPEALTRLAFLRMLGRAPTAAEAEVCRRFLERSGGPSRGVEGLVRALFSHEDFLSIR